MLDSITNRVSGWQVAALGAVLALIVAAVAVATTSAENNCLVGNTVTLGFAETCDITLADLDEDADAASETIPTDGGATGTAVAVSGGIATITAGSTVGTATVTITKPDGDDTDSDPDVVDTFTVNIVGFGIKMISFAKDNDGVFSIGESVNVNVAVRSAVSASRVRLVAPAASGILVNTHDTDGTLGTSRVIANASAATGTSTFSFTLNTNGASEGQYNLSITADQDGDFSTNDNISENESDRQQTRTLPITISNSANSVKSVKFVHPDNHTGYSAAANGGMIEFTVLITNAADNPADNNNVSLITVSHDGLLFTDGSGGVFNPPGTIVDGKFTFEVRSHNNLPTRSNVQVKVYGKDYQYKETVVEEAIFTGSVKSIVVSDAVDYLSPFGDDNEIKLGITGYDGESGSGNAVSPGTRGFITTVTDPSGGTVDRNVISVGQPMMEDGKYYILLTANATESEPLAIGEYIVDVANGSLTDGANFFVRGDAHSISFTEDRISVSLNDIITIEATVTDSNGSNVADGTPVTWKTFGNLVVDRLLDNDTKNGKASAKFAVSRLADPDGSRTATITAAVENTSAFGVVTVDLPAQEEAPEVVGLDCLSNKTGFSTYTCGVDSSASELFELISSRGATAIHLHNGTNWVRYSMVDGATVPGSLDFTVQTSNVLYISN